MPRRTVYALCWQPRERAYVLLRDGQPLVPALRLAAPAWWERLAEAGSFAFTSATGATCTVRLEPRQRGGAYWWAYKRTGGRMAKRYLGRTEEMTLTRLEEAADALAGLAYAADAPAIQEPSVGRSAAVAAGTPAGPPVLSPPARPPRPRAARTPQPPAPPAVAARAGTLALLATKFYMPRATTPVIERPHVRRRLGRGLELPVTLLSAPAGFGKTTALEDWLRGERVRAAWVSLDAADDDQAQFWTYVLTALQQAWPGAGEMALAMLHAPHPPSPLAVARALLNAVAALPRQVVLVLDDYHSISNPTIHESIAALLEHPPPQLHLYLAARSEPPLPLARLRVKGWINEVRADHLRLRPDEIATFLTDVLDVQLTVEEVLTLADRTDGWAAGVYLAGLSLQSHPEPARFIAAFGGSHRHVMTYLGDEVLAAQPEEMREFLLRTAVLDRFCAPLCEAITGRRDSRILLERLERANLFLVPLDDEGTWFRYYHLFAELLRHRLQREDAALVPELHRRAARWLEAAGALTEAVTHWLAVPDAGAAASAVERAVWAMMRSGEVPEVLGLLSRLPEAAIAARPALCLAYAQSLFGQGQLTAAERWIGQAERALRAHPPGDAPCEGDERSLRALASDIATGEALVASWRGDADAAERYSRAALAAWPEADAPERAGPMLTLGHAHRLRGDLRAAAVAYQEADRLSFAAGNLFLGTLALTQRGYTLSLAGRLRDAAALYRQAIERAEARGGAGSALAATPYAGLGDVLYQWNDLAGARQALEHVIALAEQWETTEDQVSALALLAHTLQAQGDSSAALAAMARAQELVGRGAHFPWLAAYVSSLEARLALRQGRPADAERWAAGREYSATHYATHEIKQVRHLSYLTGVRLSLARREPARAVEVAEIVLRSAESDGQRGAAIEALALRALARQAQGDVPGALEDLQGALSLALPEGYVRLFLDAGSPMAALLARLRATLAVGTESRRYAEALLAAARHATPPSVAAPGPLPEPLSAREREVLHLLARGRSNVEIARQLVVAVSTVKTHLHHIYAKLHTSDRLSAVLRARTLGLLEE